MKIAVIGGAGAMARTAVRDLSEDPEVEKILAADYQADKAKAYADSFHDPRIKGGFVDAFRIEETAALLKGYDTVINAAQYYVNLNLMKACLQARAHYNDLGGMFHTTRRQLELFDEFKKAGLSAILGIGAAPGTINVLARYAYDRLDAVEAVRLSDGTIDLTDMHGLDVFVPPYSIRTLMEEYSDESVQFLDGEYKTLPPLSGEMEIDFPAPIGRMKCFHTLHSEPATIPRSFKAKGVREVTWRLGLPPALEAKARFLAGLGFADQTPVWVQGQEVTPRDVLAAVVEKQIKDKLAGVELTINDAECIRAQVIGVQAGRRVEYVLDCLIRPHSRWGGSCGDASTGVPPAVAARMQTRGLIPPGVWGPEQVIAPEPYFRELAGREMKVMVTKREDLT